MNKLPLRARLATSVGGAASKVSRLAGRGDGSVIGGVIGLRLEPGLLAMLAQDRQVVLVTGTNGKTTTTRLVKAALAPLGEHIAVVWPTNIKTQDPVLPLPAASIYAMR